MSKDTPFSALQQLLIRTLNIKAEDVVPMSLGFLMLFSLFVCYFSMRPIRETMGIVGGISHLQWLFTATFIVTLALSPVFGWLVSTVKRRYITRWLYGFFIINILIFAGALGYDADSVWLARLFFVWLSVFNLMAISLAWSVLVDIFDSEQAKKLFAIMASGASLGGLVGPLIGLLFVKQIGHDGLLFFAALMLFVTIVCTELLSKYSSSSLQHSTGANPKSNKKALGGNPFEGVIHVLTNPLLRNLAIFVVLLASVNTFLYFEQARYVSLHFTDRAEQTRFFSGLDVIVQSITLFIQIFLTGRIAAKMGLRILLIVVPILMSIGFVMLSFSSLLAVFVLIMIIRRVGEYAFVRPAREMLFTVIDTSDKYKAKNFIDTVVYRGSDAVSGWLKAWVDFLFHPQMAALAGAGLAVAWLCAAHVTLRHYQKMLKPAASPTKELTH